MKKLKIAFLWHQHQPYYKIENEFILPWVMLHGTKDYFDLPEVFYEFPNIKQTINFTPSLLLQIEEYVSGKAKDKIQILSSIKANELSYENKLEILNLFFLANYENLIAKYPRYLELYNQSKDTELAINNFKENDWLDLQVWYNLVWFGYFSSRTDIAKRLIAKGKDFTEFEKQTLQNKQIDILRQISYQYRKLYELGQIELSSSPMFHPIMPLLIDSKASLESRPNQKLPEPIFQFPEDAEFQLNTGIDYFKKVFSHTPKGIWPSEGSVSDDTLDLFIKKGIKWIATDEQILHNSLKNHSYIDTEKFFPRKFKSKNGEITILFRDHFLSDRIGFVYSNWNEKDAVSDFLNHLKSIKSEIINNHTEDSLDYACVSVILDGENCWEYYKDNGIPFLRELFTELSNSEEFVTVTCSEACDEKSSSFQKEINHIFSGSWINANFDIWIGDKEDIKAWNVLSKARYDIEKYKDNISISHYENARNYLLISEGSDWFWWYGPEHQTKNKNEFDSIFRHYIKKAYQEIGLEIPEELNISITENLQLEKDKYPDKKIENIINYEEILNKNSGRIKLLSGMSSMHQIGEMLDYIVYANDDRYLYIYIKFLNEITDDYELKFYSSNKNKEFYITKNSIRGDIENSIIENTNYGLLIGLSENYSLNDEFLNISIETRYKGTYIKYPQNDFYKLKMCYD